MKRKTRISSSDAALFRQEVKQANPLKQDKVTPYRHLPTAQVKRAPRVDALPLHSESESTMGAGGRFIPDPVEASEALLFHRPGLQRSLLRKFQRGKFTLEAELDLHGMTVTEAEHCIEEFLSECRQRNIRFAVIIHGKGHRASTPYPALKNSVNHWLRAYHEVLAFCSARPADGGTGALYVLLKTAPRDDASARDQ
ncbi:MAG: DNA mismatch repair protein MutS [Gammaproteobacteria bacterium]|nr:DNA mismatch repair protein MutS [Gammaproteobacteria bacterium]